jgi:tetratricopeptide (TPR) repeat protein
VVDAHDPTLGVDDLARHCGQPVAVVRGWVERGLLAVERGHVDRFSFRAIGVARTLSQFRRAGWNVARIERGWALARTVVADPEAALFGLLASIDQRRVLVRTPDGRLVEPGGQLVFDFHAGAAAAAAEAVPLRRPRDWFVVGVEAEAAGRLEDAVRAYERSLPDSGAEGYFNLGNCLYALRRRDAARAQFAAATSAAPDYAEAWNNLGIVAGDLGDRDGAIAALRRAIELVPHYADAHYNLGEALAVVGEREAARHHWRAYLAFDPNSRWAERVRRRLAANRGEA